MIRAAYWLMILTVALSLAGCGGAAPAPKAESAVPAESASLEAAPADAGAPEAAVDPSAVVARVNQTDITESQIQEMLDRFMGQMGGQVPPDQMADLMPRIRERILEELIMRQVMVDAVAREGISLTDEEFAEVKTELAQELPPGTVMEDYMAEAGISEGELREQMTVRKMIIARADAVAQPTPAEIRDFYDQNQEGFAQDASVTASHILIKFGDDDDDAAKTAKRERLASLREELLAGADFAEMARNHSDCPSRSNGGDLGAFGRGQMVPEFEDAAFSQDVDVVGDIVETQFGYHLIKVTGKTEAKTPDFDEVQERIREILYSQRQQEAVREFVDGIREAASIERMGTPPSEEMLLELDAEEEAMEAEEISEDVELLEEAVAAIEEAAADLNETAEAAVETAEDTVEEAAEALDEAAEDLSETAEATAEAATDAAADVIEEAATAVEETVEAASEEIVPAVEEAAVPESSEEPAGDAVPAEDVNAAEEPAED